MSEWTSAVYRNITFDTIFLTATAEFIFFTYFTEKHKIICRSVVYRNNICVKE